MQRYWVAQKPILWARGKKGDNKNQNPGTINWNLAVSNTWMQICIQSYWILRKIIKSPSKTNEDIVKPLKTKILTSPPRWINKSFPDGSDSLSTLLSSFSVSSNSCCSCSSSPFCSFSGLSSLLSCDSGWIGCSVTEPSDHSCSTFFVF